MTAWSSRVRTSRHSWKKSSRLKAFMCRLFMMCLIMKMERLQLSHQNMVHRRKSGNALFPIWEMSIIQNNLLFHLQKLCMTEPWKKSCGAVFGAVDSVRLGLSIVHFERNQRRLSVGRQSSSAGIRVMTNFPCRLWVPATTTSWKPFWQNCSVIRRNERLQWVCRLCEWTTFLRISWRKWNASGKVVWRLLPKQEHSDYEMSSIKMWPKKRFYGQHRLLFPMGIIM